MILKFYCKRLAGAGIRRQVYGPTRKSCMNAGNAINGIIASGILMSRSIVVHGVAVI